MPGYRETHSRQDILTQSRDIRTSEVDKDWRGIGMLKLLDQAQLLLGINKNVLCFDCGVGKSAL